MEIANCILKLFSSSISLEEKVFQALKQLGFEKLQDRPLGSLEVFTVWVKENAPDSLVGEVCAFASDLQEGNGIIALEEIKKGKSFIRIPRRLMMISSHVKKCAKLKDIADDPKINWNESILLALWLVQELRDEHSFWRPYIDILPQNVSIPLNFSIDDLQLMRQRDLYPKTLHLLKNFIMGYVYTISKYGIDVCSWPEFKWALSIVLSRQNRIPASKGDEFDIALIPGWDMCNHREGEILSFYDTESDTIDASTDSLVLKGEQIYMSYGIRPNSELFLFSGFVTDSMDIDEVQVTLSVDTSDPLFRMKKLFLSKLDLKTTESFMISKESQDAVFAFLSLSLMTKVECEAYLRKNELPQNSELVSSHLISALEHKLEGISEINPTTANGKVVKSLIECEKNITAALIAHLRCL